MTRQMRENNIQGVEKISKTYLVSFGVRVLATKQVLVAPIFT